MPNQNLTNRSALIIFLLSAVLLSLSPRFAESTETREWSLRASAEKAIARLNPEADMTRKSAGSIVPQMMEKMMFGGPDIREGKKGEKYGAFFGLKISLKLKGGWNIFSGADLDPGSGGLYDRAIDDLLPAGRQLSGTKRDPIMPALRRVETSSIPSLPGSASVSERGAFTPNGGALWSTGDKTCGTIFFELRLYSKLVPSGSVLSPHSLSPRCWRSPSTEVRRSSPQNTNSVWGSPASWLKWATTTFS